MNIRDYEKNYLVKNKDKEHGEFVKNLSVNFFKKLIPIFKEEMSFLNNGQDVRLLEYGAFLHDIGSSLEKKMDKPHNKISRDLILENKIDGLNETENLIVANIARYHRKANPDAKKHQHFAKLNDTDKKKVQVLSAIVRLADAFDYMHFELHDKINLNFENDSRVLTLQLCANIMLNVGQYEVLEKKKELLEETFNIKVVFKNP